MWCIMLQCVAVCCSLLKKTKSSLPSHCVASESIRACCIVTTVRCSVLQCVAVCCSVLQCVAVCCSVLQFIAVCNGLQGF